jgi:hypothetical protein
MRTTHRIMLLVMASVLFVAIAAVPVSAGNEGTLLSRINASRAAAGLAPVEVYWDLTDDARAHTTAMINKGSIYHNPNLSGVTSVWHALGENVGVGFDANQLHDAFMASSGHRANILGNYNYVGIGAQAGADGLIWATIIFMRADPGLNGGPATTTTVPPTTTTTAPPTTTTQAPVVTTTTVGTPVTPATTTPATTTPSTPLAPAPTSETDGNSSSEPAPADAPIEGYGRPAGPAYAV